LSKIIIHVGYPKTATTTMQKQLFEKLYEEGQINYLGKYYSIKNGLVGNSIVHYLLYDKKIDGYNKDILTIKEISKNNKLTVLSNEGLSISFLKYINNKIDPSYVAEKINNLFAEIFEKVEILMTVRNQVDMLYSIYVQYYGSVYRYIKKLNNIEKFLSDGLKERKNGNFFMFYYGDMYKIYSKIFGKDKINILLYEELINNIENYTFKVSKIMDISQEVVLNSFSKKENKKRVTKTKNYLTNDINLSLMVDIYISKILRIPKVLKFKKMFYDDTFIKHFYHTKIKEKMNNIVIKRGIEIPRFDENTILKIKSEFYETNNILQKEANIDRNLMIKYGYLN